MRTRAIPRLLAALLCGLSASCSGSWQGTEETIDGTKVIHNQQGRWANDPQKSVTFIEELSIGDDTSNSDRLLRPSAVAADGEGNIYVADKGTCQIHRFDRQGKHLWSVGSEGAGPLNFKSPEDIAVGPEGNLHIVDSVLRRVAVLDSSGTFVHSFPTYVTAPRQIEVDARSNLYLFAITQTDLIYKFDHRGRFLGSMYNPDREDRNLFLLFAFSSGDMRVAPSGRVYFSHTFPYAIAVLDEAGKEKLRVTRKTGLAVAPRVPLAGRRFSSDYEVSSGKLLVLPDGRMLNFLTEGRYPEPGTGELPKITRWVDLYDRRGRLLKTSPFAGQGLAEHADRKGKVYFIEPGPPSRVTRCRLSLEQS